jgi:hypothetical protein
VGIPRAGDDPHFHQEYKNKKFLFAVNKFVLKTRDLQKICA